MLINMGYRNCGYNGLTILEKGGMLEKLRPYVEGIATPFDFVFFDILSI